MNRLEVPTTTIWNITVETNQTISFYRFALQIFDLKGSMRNRKVNATGKENEVLLDENLVECKSLNFSVAFFLTGQAKLAVLVQVSNVSLYTVMYQSPLFLRAHSKEILRGSLHNDTLFLSRLNVMDYSLLVGIDETSQELVVGIVGNVPHVISRPP